LSNTNTRLCALALGAALTSSGVAQVAPNTLPGGGNVTAGSAAISTPAAGTMQIDQATQRAAIDWQSFSIGSAAWVRFNQPNASAVALNRVVGANPSEIFGRLTANGQVFLTNPSGVLFAPTARVEVGSLVATTLSIANADFMAGRNVFSNGGGAGIVVNQGTILTPNGYTALFGPHVSNEGVIVARLGSVALAAGDRVSLDLIGDGLISISVDQGALNASVVNTGTIEADGGRVLLTARGAGNLLDGVINSSGVIRASSLVERNGEVILEASGSINIAGDIVGLTTATIEAGGSINITGSISGSIGATIVLGTSGPLDIIGDNAVSAPGGSVTIGAGVISLSSVDSINVIGGSLQLSADALVSVAGSFLVAAGAGVFTIVDPQAEQRALAATITQAVSAISVRDAQAAMSAAALAESRGHRPSILSEPIGFVPPMRHRVEADGIAIPPGVTLPPQR
jgi:filamentous hemagglutinin family protein